MSPTVIFQSPEIVARWRSPAANAQASWTEAEKVCFVSFDSFSDDASVDRDGFGERFFAEMGVDAIHFIPTRNNWYCEAAVMEALARCRAVCARFDRVIAYGSSMGGFAALRCGGAAGAKEAVALSPQFHPDPAVKPYEQRWAAFAPFFANGPCPSAFVEKAVILYDPHDADAAHAALYDDHLAVTHVRLPYAGHPVTGFLSDVDLLKILPRDIVARRFDPQAFAAAARAKRAASPWYLAALSRRMKPSARQVVIADRASRLLGRPPRLESDLARARAAIGDAQGARAALTNALAQGRDDVVVLYQTSEALERLGDLTQAIDLLLEARDGPHSPQIAQRLEHLIQQRPWPWRLSEVAPPKMPGPAYLRRLRRLWGRAPDLAVDWPQAPPLSPEALTTTTPAPPQTPSAWRRHLEIVNMARQPYDIALLGDEHLDQWPEVYFYGARLVRLTQPEERVQTLIWRLTDLADRPFAADRLLLCVGAANLQDGDGADAVTVGVKRLLCLAKHVFPGARTVLLPPPPLPHGPAFETRRRDALQTIRALESVTVLDVDRALHPLGPAGFDPQGRGLSARGQAAIADECHRIFQI